MSSDSSKTPEPSAAEKNHRLDQAKASDDSLQQVHSTLLREKMEPTENSTPIPTWLIFGIMILGIWGGFYIAFYSGGFDAMVYDETLFGRGAETTTDDNGEIDVLLVGERMYSRNCQVCHQANGEGSPGAFPSLVGSERVLGSEQVLTRILLHGLNGADYTGEMPPFGSLPDQQIAAVMTFIRQEWGNDAPEISEGTVAAIREEESGRTATWGYEELEAFAGNGDENGDNSEDASSEEEDADLEEDADPEE
ncbi:MAG: cytochrome c [Opitutales bacterium]|nr:cytochrome c [Opitutales bacterium]MCH8540307.1 cytochrome c [Opitutales bacterium]